MQKLIENFVMTRCEEAKLGDEKYLEYERNSNDTTGIQAEAETICYLKGIKDAVLILKKLDLIKM